LILFGICQLRKERVIIASKKTFLEYADEKQEWGRGERGKEEKAHLEVHVAVHADEIPLVLHPPLESDHYWFPCQVLRA
jgi:hypothetical protein